MIELFSLTCGYLLKNEPELKKEVNGIMIPIVMTQTERAERAEYEIKLIVEEKNRIEEEMHRIRQGMQKAEKENDNAIRKSIEKFCFFGQSWREVKGNIQDIFSLDEAEAEEKMKKYWVQVECSR